MVAGSPFMCMRQTAHWLFATACRAPSACKASMSLIIEAPALSAACITSGRLVSTERGFSSCLRPSSTGRILSNSSDGDTGRAPGREDSPPISMMSAPSSASLCAWAMAAFASKNLPPSEKESGVTLTTPITRGLPRSSRNRPAASRLIYALRRGMRCHDSLFSARRRRRRVGRTAGGFRRARRPALHDVVHLLGVECFPFEQRLGHDLDLLAVLVDEPARLGVHLVDDAPDLGVDLLHGRFRDILVLRHRAAEEHLAVVLAVHHRAELVGHTVARHHIASDVGRALEVLARAGGLLVEEQLFGDAAAE